MKAAQHTQYGPPEVVRIVELDKPVPKDGEILIRVYASTVNRTDSGFRSAEYIISRFWSGLFKPNQTTLGSEFAGVVESIGKNVTLFQEGDRVFGYDDVHFGGHAEYLCLSEKESITTIPDGISYTVAAAVTEGAHYALNNIRASGIQAGQKALVYGATGAIGSAAVQLLKAKNIWVTAVCSTPYIQLIQSLGADEVIDYTQQDYTHTHHRYELVFDAVGKTSFAHCKPVLTNTGIYISTELGKGGQNVFYALVTPLLKGKKVLFPIPIMNKEILEELKTLLIEGKFTPVIDRQYSLEQIVEAYQYVETGQKIGNVILKIQE